MHTYVFLIQLFAENLVFSLYWVLGNTTSNLPEDLGTSRRLDCFSPALWRWKRDPCGLRVFRAFRSRRDRHLFRPHLYYIMHYDMRCFSYHNFEYIIMYICMHLYRCWDIWRTWWIVLCSCFPEGASRRSMPTAPAQTLCAQLSKDAHIHTYIHTECIHECICIILVSAVLEAAGLLVAPAAL